MSVVNLQLLVFVVLIAVSVLAAGYGLFYSRLEKAKLVNRRFEAVCNADADRQARRENRDRTADLARRRKSLQDTLKELETREKESDQRSPPLKLLLRQAGLPVSVRMFYLYSVVAGLVLALTTFLAGMPHLITAGLLLVVVFGAPRWLVLYLRNRRVKAFLEELPNALDAIIRAVRSGLPINEGIKLVAAEAREPVREEFRRVVESQQLGLTLPEAALRIKETMPCPEASFFGIVIQIQQQAGGNLSETLGNLSRVLRDRKKMKAKISALSMESRASAAIIGAMPVLVGTMVFFVSPGYIMPLFTTDTGHFLLGISAVWMAIGIVVMRQMMNFEI